eukprot:1195497-Prorocentrum_minimum.AAC.1
MQLKSSYSLCEKKSRIVPKEVASHTSTPLTTPIGNILAHSKKLFFCVDHVGGAWHHPGRRSLVAGGAATLFVGLMNARTAEDKRRKFLLC